MRKIIGLGETVLDIIFKNHQVQKAVPGGSTFNAMISLGRAKESLKASEEPKGFQCVMATEIGDDRVGTIVENFLRDNGVSTDYVYRHPCTQSHISLAFLNERNDAEYSFYKMHGDLDMPMENIPEINAGDIVIFGSFFAINPKLRRYVSTFLNRAKASGAILYYDINFRASHLKDLPQVMPFIEENMRLATVVRGSSEDFNILYGTTTAEDAYEHVRPLCCTFIYTDADKPIQVFSQRLRVSVPVQQIDTVSTIGAGDNFNAGFCYGLYILGISSPEQMVEASEAQMSRIIAYGQQFSAIVCQSLDNYIPTEHFFDEIVV